MISSTVPSFKRSTSDLIFSCSGPRLAAGERAALARDTCRVHASFFDRHNIVGFLDDTKLSCDFRVGPMQYRQGSVSVMLWHVEHSRIFSFARESRQTARTHLPARP